MSSCATDLQSRWPKWWDRLRAEYARLPADDRHWLAARATDIRIGQERLDHLFRAVSGVSTCAACRGGCCGAGRHHLTLGNLLPYLASGDQPPVPDFSQPCPYLGADGCRLPVPARPYNCITFFCADLENRFSAEQQKIWQQADQAIRSAYGAIAERYPVGSRTGFWLAAERLGDRPFLYDSAPNS